MHAIEDKENFSKELISTLDQMDERIDTLSEKMSIYNGVKTDENLSTLNELKLHRYKVKETLKRVETIDEEIWQKEKEQYQKIFKEAEELLVI